MAQVPTGYHITYQQQYQKCGKPSCKTCRESKGHGPYWYAYWHESGKLRSTYVGKTLPIGAQEVTANDHHLRSVTDGCIITT